MIPIYKSWGESLPTGPGYDGIIIGVSGVWISVAANQLRSTLSKPFFLMQVKKNPRCDVSLKEKKKPLCKLRLGGSSMTIIFFFLWPLFCGDKLFSHCSLPSHLFPCFILAEYGNRTRVSIRGMLFLSVWMCKSWDKSYTQPECLQVSFFFWTSLTSKGCWTQSNVL